MLQVPTSGGRHLEWSETLSPNAIAIADRNTGTTANATSVHSNQRDRNRGIGGWPITQRRYSAGWAGEVVRNDNSVRFETTHLLDTQYAGHAHVDDHLFEAAGDNDAYLVHSGN